MNKLTLYAFYSLLVAVLAFSVLLLVVTIIDCDPLLWIGGFLILLVVAIFLDNVRDSMND